MNLSSRLNPDVALFQLPQDGHAIPDNNFVVVFLRGYNPGMGQPNDLNAAAMVAAAATATATATASVVALRDRNDQYGQVGGSSAASIPLFVDF